MTDVLVSSYQAGGSAGQRPAPTENVNMAFAKVEFTYKPQKADGSSGRRHHRGLGSEGQQEGLGDGS